MCLLEVTVSLNDDGAVWSESGSPHVHVLVLQGLVVLLTLFQLANGGRRGERVHPGQRWGLDGLTNWLLLGFSYKTDRERKKIWIKLWEWREIETATSIWPLKTVWNFLCTAVEQKEVRLLTVAPVWLSVLSSGGPRLGDPVSLALLLTAVRRHRRLAAERHDGGGCVGGGGVVLGVGEAVQIFAGGIYSAIDGTFGGATHAVLLRLVQVVGDASFYTGPEGSLSFSSVCSVMLQLNRNYTATQPHTIVVSLSCVVIGGAAVYGFFTTVDQVGGGPRVCQPRIVAHVASQHARPAETYRH